VRKVLIFILFWISGDIFGQNRQPAHADSVEIRINNASHALIPVRHTDSFLRAHPSSFLKADSAVMRRNKIILFYTSLWNVDTVIFITSRPVPKSVYTYYNNIIKHYPFRQTGIPEELKNDFIEVKKIYMLTENTKNALYFKAEYHPPGEAEALVHLERREGKTLLFGNARMQLHRLFSGNDRLEFLYSADKQFKKLNLAYTLRHLTGRPWDWKNFFIQYKEDTLFSTQWQSVISYRKGRWNWMGGWNIHNGYGVFVRQWLVGMGWKHVRYNHFIHSEALLFWNASGIRRMYLHLSLEGGKKIFWRFHTLYDRIYEMVPGLYGMYRRYDNADLLINPFLNIYTEAGMHAGWRKKDYEFYIFDRGFGVFPQADRSLWRNLSGAGISIFQKNTRTDLEFSYPVYFVQKTENQRILFTISQRFFW